jgi:hypothetical protein
MENANLTSANVDAVQTKLQALYEGLPEEEKPVLETVLSHAAEGGRQSVSQATGEERSIIIVGGRTGGLEIPLNPGVLAGLNPQPIPPGREPVGPDPSPFETDQR